MKTLFCVVAIAIAGCGDSGYTVSGSTKFQSIENEQALRVRIDTVRNRRWVLNLDHVNVYDRATKKLIRRIALPGWSVADFMCLPDMALDESGTAFISHNLQPRLWQIDANTFQLTEHVIRLVNREHWDTGFGDLAFGPDGTLSALPHPAGLGGGSISATRTRIRSSLMRIV